MMPKFCNHNGKLCAMPNFVRASGKFIIVKEEAQMT
jgi:hypothetical protein